MVSEHRDKKWPAEDLVIINLEIHFCVLGTFFCSALIKILYLIQFEAIKYHTVVFWLFGSNPSVLSSMHTSLNLSSYMWHAGKRSEIDVCWEGSGESQLSFQYKYNNKSVGKWLFIPLLLSANFKSLFFSMKKHIYYHKSEYYAALCTKTSKHRTDSNIVLYILYQLLIFYKYYNDNTNKRNIENDSNNNDVVRLRIIIIIIIYTFFASDRSLWFSSCLKFSSRLFFILHFAVTSYIITLISLCYIVIVITINIITYYIPNGSGSNFTKSAEFKKCPLLLLLRLHQRKLELTKNQQYSWIYSHRIVSIRK